MHAGSNFATKVPKLTLGFWVAKVAATTLGETGGDTVTMTLKLGYLAGAVILFGVLLHLISLQIRATEFRPLLYWTTIVASTMFGTATADYIHRSLGLGFFDGALLLLMALLGVLGLWYALLGSVSMDTVSEPASEAFYWTAVTISQTLGTALGDWVSVSKGLGYGGSALVFASALMILVACYYWTNISRVTLFWTAFILTRPLGATAGDFLDKPLSDGGLAVSRPIVSLLLAAFIFVCIFFLPQRPGTRSSTSVS
jgi:uncharacterized membrane-anchored protein